MFVNSRTQTMHSHYNFSDFNEYNRFGSLVMSVSSRLRSEKLNFTCHDVFCLLFYQILNRKGCGLRKRIVILSGNEKFLRAMTGSFMDGIVEYPFNITYIPWPLIMLVVAVFPEYSPKSFYNFFRRNWLWVINRVQSREKRYFLP